jgi:hypothetical protein
MQFSTNIDGNRLTFRCHEALHLQAEWLLNFVRNIAKKGESEVLRDGNKIQFGWSVLTVVESGPGSFVLVEPDFSDDPFHGVRDNLACTLRVQADQNAFSMKIGVKPIVTSFRDKVVYSKSCIGERSIYLERRRPRPTDSGWFIGSNRHDYAHSESEELTACYAYELLRLRPEVMKVLQLPPGYLIAFDGPDVEAVLARDDETVFSR